MKRILLIALALSFMVSVGFAGQTDVDDEDDIVWENVPDIAFYFRTAAYFRGYWRNITKHK